MLYLHMIPDHRCLPCYIWHLIYDIGTQYLHRYSVFTPALGMLHLIYDIWHRYLPCYIWHMIRTPVFAIFNTDTCHAIFDTGNCHAIFDTGTSHAIFVIWYLTSVLAMLYLTLDIWHWYLTCYICHLIYNTWYLTPGTCITWHIHDYYVTRHLSLLYLLYSCTPVSLELLHSWTLVLLNPWNREAPDITPDIILLLTPVIR